MIDTKMKGTCTNFCIVFCSNKLSIFKLKNEALAYVIETKGKAEAENIVKKADTLKEYEDAAMVDMLLETLPKVSF